MVKNSIMNAKLLRVAGAASALALVAVSAACSSNSPEAPGSTGTEKVTLNLLSAAVPGTPGGDLYAQIFKQFEADTGIAVKAEGGGEDTGVVFETAAAADKLPDLVFLNGQAPVSWAEKGLIVTVDKYMDEWGIRDRIIPAAYDEINQDFGMPGFPYEGYQWPVWWNTDLLAKTGVSSTPKTIDELLSFADSARAAGLEPVAIGGADWSGQKLFFQVAQSYLETEPLIKLYNDGGWCASPEGMKGIDLFVKLRDAGVFAANAEGYEAPSMTAQFMAGEAVAMPSGSWTISEVPSGVEGLAEAIEFGGFPIPSDGVFSKPTAFQGVSNAWWISKTGQADKIDAIRQFIEYMYSPEVTARLINEVDLILATVNDESLLTGGNALIAQVQSELPGRVDYALLPDFYIAADITESIIRATAVAFQPGKSAQDICTTVDSVYGA